MPPPLRTVLARSPLTATAQRHVSQHVPQPPVHFSTRPPLRSLRARLRQIYGPEPAPPANIYDAQSMARYERVRRAYWFRRQKIGVAGALAGMAGLALCAWLAPSAPVQQTEAPPGAPPFGATGGAAGVVLSSHNLVATGTDNVPFFPRTMHLQSAAGASGAATAPSLALPAGTALPGAADEKGQELTLLGLGIRTVSFLSIQVYVVGLYVATSDLAALQARMVKAGAEVEGASTLVGQEVENLKRRLLDPEESLLLWNKILREEGVRSVVRVVPTRSTDYSHLRDGWVTGMTARSGNFGTGLGGEKFDDDQFGDAVAQFKAMLGGRKSLGKGRVLLLEREASGRLLGWEETGNIKQVRTDASNVEGAKFKNIGVVEDERIARLIWLGYLGGKKVSSEGARRNIVDGVMELVTRPVGTVETMVV